VHCALVSSLLRGEFLIGWPLFLQVVWHQFVGVCRGILFVPIHLDVFGCICAQSDLHQVECRCNLNEFGSESRRICVEVNLHLVEFVFELPVGSAPS